MAETGHGFTEALAEATELGYAEADPTADVDGFDAAAKAAILASLAFHTPVTAADVYREGISAVTSTDVARAAEIGCTVKLLAICERVPGADGRASPVAVRVHPAMIPTSHPLAAVGGAFNAVFVEAEAAGQLMFYGQGAGGDATASAVLGDLVAVARNRASGVAGPGVTTYAGLPRGRSPRPRPGTTSASTSPTGRACSRRWRRSSPGTGSASPPCARTGTATPPRWSS
jgi:homoserine dehydrogenase